MLRNRYTPTEKILDVVTSLPPETQITSDEILALVNDDTIARRNVHAVANSCACLTPEPTRSRRENAWQRTSAPDGQNLWPDDCSECQHSGRGQGTACLPIIDHQASIMKAQLPADLKAQTILNSVANQLDN